MWLDEAVLVQDVDVPEVALQVGIQRDLGGGTRLEQQIDAGTCVRSDLANPCAGLNALAMMLFVGRY